MQTILKTWWAWRRWNLGMLLVQTLAWAMLLQGHENMFVRFTLSVAAIHF
jgi:hypothetical protein